MAAQTKPVRDSIPTPALVLAMDLGKQSWKLCFGVVGQGRVRETSVAGGDTEGLVEAIERARSHFELGPEVAVYSCYEAGRDGFWLHRFLVAQGIHNVIVEPASLPVTRRARRTKTDRLDARTQLQVFMRHLLGEPKVLSVVAVPPAEIEDARGVERERQRLLKEACQHRNRVRSALVRHGIALARVVVDDLRRDLESFRQHDGTPLGLHQREEIERELERLEVVERQIGAIERERLERLRTGLAAGDRVAQQVGALMTLCGIGPVGAWRLVLELFAWRPYRNRRAAAALVGLAPTPWASGEMSRELGISKAGNGDLRSLLIELSWLWLRYQPRSKHARWFQARFGPGGKRSRRIGIVAVARRLLIDLWRFVDQGVIPEGAQLRVKVRVAA